MARTFLLMLALSAFNCGVLSQMLRPPMGLPNGPLADILESPRQLIQQIPESPLFEYITQPVEPYNNILPVANPLNIPKYPQNTNYRGNSINIPNTPSTILITDSSPSVCKNLANTIQLMIVSNLLESQQGGEELAIQLAAPILRELLSAPVRYGAPNTIPYLRSAVSSGIVKPSLIASSMANPAVISPILASSPRVVPSSCGGTPTGQIDRGLLTSLLQILGGGAQLQ